MSKKFLMAFARVKNSINARRSRFKECEAINMQERYSVDNYMIASASFNDVLQGIKPSRSRLAKSWTIISLMIVMTTLFFIPAYTNNLKYLITFGIPLGLFG